MPRTLYNIDYIEYFIHIMKKWLCHLFSIIVSKNSAKVTEMLSRVWKALVVFYSDENHLTINPLSKPITLSQPPPVILVCDLF